VALVTRTVRGLAVEVRLGRREGLPSPCVVNFDNIVTINRTRLIRLLGALSSEKVAEVNQAIKLALDIK